MFRRDDPGLYTANQVAQFIEFGIQPSTGNGLKNNDSSRKFQMSIERRNAKLNPSETAAQFLYKDVLILCIDWFHYKMIVIQILKRSTRLNAP